MGWTEEQTLSADVNAIIVAQQGRIGMINAIFGGGETKPGAKAEQQAMTPELFRAMFDRS